MEPAERELDRITQKLENMWLRFSTTGHDRMDVQLANAEISVREIQSQLCEAEQVVSQLHDIENEVASELASRKDKSFCSRTGLELSTELNEMVISGFKWLSARIGHVQSRCDESLALIDMKRQELRSFLEAIALNSQLDG